ncbi:MAG: flagellar hook-basal body complex protein FliE [Pseudomonadota bacterium]
MSTTDINSLLAQMRVTTARLEKSLPPARPEGVSDNADFNVLLKDSIQKVSDTQKTAATMAQSFEQGDPSSNLTEVMIQVQKADLSFRAMTEVRNKLVTAYQEIMNMPV